MHCLHLITYNFQTLILMPRLHRSIKISHLPTELLKMYKSSKNQRARSIQPQIPEISVQNVNGLVSVQPEKFRKNTFWGGPLFPVGLVWSKNDRSIRPFRLILIPSGGFSQSVCESRLQPFPPKPIIARNFGQQGCQHGLTHAQITQQKIKNGSRTYRKYGTTILLSGFS